MHIIRIPVPFIKSKYKITTEAARTFYMYAIFHLTLVLKVWELHGKTMKNSGGKIHGWIPYKTIEHGARAKFDGFYGNISMLSMVAWDRKIVRRFPIKPREAWNVKPWEA